MQDDDTAVIESPAEQVEESSDDLRTQLQTAFREAGERSRDEAGRFAREAEQAAAEPAASPAPAETAPKPAAETSAADASAAAPAPAPAAETVKAPDAWSPAAKAKFAALDPEVQAEIARREAEVHKGFTKQDEHRNLGKSFADAVNPYLPIIKAEGGNPITAVQDLLQTAYTLRTGTPQAKEALLLGVAKQYGIDLNSVFTRLYSGQPAAQVDPTVQALQQQVQQLQQVIQGGQQQQESQEQAQLHQTIEGFASDPKNVYFSNVKAEMAALLRNGTATDLQGAYDMACWARPDIRVLLLQQQDQQKQAATRQRTQQARFAGSSISGSPSPGAAVGGTPVPGASLADDIRSAIRDVSGRL